ncbi:glycosyltransferase [Sphingomonas canadensis]|uniref:Glycosyltransferase n=1 Tax=Sphingomonas canadensis TaxID=1219257 RepID=A0ABW3H8A0_9SPHN|nr:glycosyltransferase [Sphingomonas canadensis]MCW3837126.1 glycosyltransferase [Sphingomonas canadensis]
MRIVHAITRFIRGGADENTLLTVNGQAAAGHDVHLIHGDYHETMIAAVDPRVTLHHEPSLVRAVRPVEDLRCLRAMTRYFREHRPDIVHTHESKAGAIGRAAAWRARVPTIVHTVHILPFIGVSAPVAAVYLGIEKLAARVTRAFIDVSPGMREACLERGIGTAANHRVIESGMDIDRFRAAAPLAEFAAEGVVTGLISGTLEPRKRVAELIEALVRSGRSDWRLLIAGAGDEQERIAALVRAHGLEQRVLLLGFRPDLDRLIASADICIHAATNEGLPRVIVQYVLAGRPVVASHLVGIEYVVRDGANGLIVDGGDTDALASAFFALADDPARRAAMAEAARAIDLSRWDHREMVRAIEEVYAAAVGQGATPPAPARV